VEDVRKELWWNKNCNNMIIRFLKAATVKNNISEEAGSSETSQFTSRKKVIFNDKTFA
jgi:hypothetical protein